MRLVILEHIDITCITHLDINFLRDLATCVELSDHLREVGHVTLEAHCYLSGMCQSCS
jgi:hypothetical protein